MNKIKDYSALKNKVVAKISETHDPETLLQVLIDSSHNVREFLNNGSTSI
jgi:hypothetical protein